MNNNEEEDIKNYCEEDEPSYFDKDELNYDPEVNKIFVEKANRSIYELYRRYNKGEIDLSPYYQRKPMWVRTRQSKLIESILLDIPIQVIYLAEEINNQNTYYEVVDGQQRLTAFFEFLDNKFKLEKLSILKKLNGLYFNDLEPKFQRAIEDYFIAVYIIKKESEKEAKFDIFERINIGSTNLNAQEIRNCIYCRGENAEGLDLLRLLANDNHFAELVNKKVLEKRLKDEELILRFLSYYIKGIENYTGSMTKFLNDTLDNFAIYKQKLANVEEKFIKAMKYIYDFFGKNAFIINPRSTQINFALFDVLSTSFAELDESFLVENKQNIINTYNKLIQNTDYRRALTANSSTKSNTETRFCMWYDEIANYL